MVPPRFAVIGIAAAVLGVGAIYFVLVASPGRGTFSSGSLTQHILIGPGTGPGAGCYRDLPPDNNGYPTHPEIFSGPMGTFGVNKPKNLVYVMSTRLNATNYRVVLAIVGADTAGTYEDNLPNRLSIMFKWLPPGSRTGWINGRAKVVVSSDLRSGTADVDLFPDITKALQVPVGSPPPATYRGPWRCKGLF